MDAFEVEEVADSGHVSTKSQLLFWSHTPAEQHVWQRTEATAPQMIVPHVYHGPRSVLVKEVGRMRDELHITHIVQCCDRNPDFPKLFQYKVLWVNNDSRDFAEQHRQHMHDDDDDHDCASSHGPMGCPDLHLLRADESGTCLADQVNEWIDCAVGEGGNVLIVGYDGVTNSGAIVTSYVMWNKGLLWKDALEYVRSKRPIVGLIPRLEADLQRYDVRMALKRNPDALGGLRIIKPRAKRSHKHVKGRHDEEDHACDRSRRSHGSGGGDGGDDGRGGDDGSQ